MGCCSGSMGVPWKIATYRTLSSEIFSTVPLDGGKWEPVKLTALLAYRDGELFIQGTVHGQEYRDNPEDMRLIYMDYAGL